MYRRTTVIILSAWCLALTASREAGGEMRAPGGLFPRSVGSEELPQAEQTKIREYERSIRRVLRPPEAEFVIRYAEELRVPSEFDSRCRMHDAPPAAAPVAEDVCTALGLPDARPGSVDVDICRGAHAKEDASERDQDLCAEAVSLLADVVRDGLAALASARCPKDTELNRLTDWPGDWACGPRGENEEFDTVERACGADVRPTCQVTTCRLAQDRYLRRYPSGLFRQPAGAVLAICSYVDAYDKGLQYSIDGIKSSIESIANSPDSSIGARVHFLNRAVEQLCRHPLKWKANKDYLRGCFEADAVTGTMGRNAAPAAAWEASVSHRRAIASAREALRACDDQEMDQWWGEAGCTDLAGTIRSYERVASVVDEFLNPRLANYMRLRAALSK